MRRVKIAAIGTEHDHASPVIYSLKKLTDVFELVGYCNPEKLNENEKSQSKFYESIHKLTLDEIWSIPDIEAVAVETNEKSLSRYALEAVKRGFHVHMDKPGGESLEEFTELIDTVKKNNLVFHTGYMYRYNPAVIRALEIAKNGALGEIYSVETHMNCEHTLEKRQWLKQYKGGMMFFLGCHLIDLIYMFMGQPEEVIPLNTSTGYEGVDSEDFGMAVLKYKNGVSFAKTCDVEAGGFLRRQLVVCGTKGTLEINPIENISPKDEGRNLIVSLRETYADGRWTNPGTITDYPEFDRYDNMMKSFASMVRGEKKNPYTPDYELETYKLVLKACGY
ncbi:MAG: Gfo/Idh/MocA family oxidoreductase [Clostridiales bacterium]|nr:Gfo/Idh/MocA family oxidoreductase [Clostridiales bacterium]